MITPSFWDDNKRFAQGLEKDDAVKAALDLPWSNGHVEGQINRLKLIKRQSMVEPVSICCVNEFCIESGRLSHVHPHRPPPIRKRRIDFLIKSQVLLQKSGRNYRNWGSAPDPEVFLKTALGHRH
jgi:hypothetical protein